MEFTLAYITVGSLDEAKRIGRILVEERLAACVNILNDMHSMYWWEGRVQEDSEVVLIAKTRKVRFDALVERVKSLHSYQCPCVVALPLEGGNPAFLDWIQNETESAD